MMGSESDQVMTKFHLAFQRCTLRGMTIFGSCKNWYQSTAPATGHAYTASPPMSRDLLCLGRSYFHPNCSPSLWTVKALNQTQTVSHFARRSTRRSMDRTRGSPPCALCGRFFPLQSLVSKVGASTQLPRYDWSRKGTRTQGDATT